MRHRDTVRIVDENGQPVEHSPEFVSKLFDEELEQLLGEPASVKNPQAAASLHEARTLSEDMIRRHEFNPA